MVNGIKKIYRVKVRSKYGFGTFERDFNELLTANKYVLLLMMFNMSVAGKIEDLVTITEIEEKVNKEDE